MKDGETIAADLIVLATGYKRQEELVRKLFGDAVADRVGTIWGFGDEPGTAQHVYAHRPARACGSSPAASRNAGSARNISRCRSRRSRKGCAMLACEGEASRGQIA